jgi:hypothetical protein
MSETTEADYLFLPVEEAEHPVAGGFFIHYLNYWWAVHPVKGLVFYNPVKRSGRRWRSGLGAPQHNTNERIQRQMSAAHCPFEVQVRQLPSVWVQISISDYAQG